MLDFERAKMLENHILNCLWHFYVISSLKIGSTVKIPVLNCAYPQTKETYGMWHFVGVTNFVGYCRVMEQLQYQHTYWCLLKSHKSYSSLISCGRNAVITCVSGLALVMRSAGLLVVECTWENWSESCCQERRTLAMWVFPQVHCSAHNYYSQ